jgi:hypothetical protein
MEANWRKASHSDDRGGNCIELANAPATIAIRDSKNPEGPELHVPRPAFRRLTATIRVT